MDYNKLKLEYNNLKFEKEILAKKNKEINLKFSKNKEFQKSKKNK